MMDDVKTLNIIGAGLAGLSAAITLARLGIKCNLISSQPSERAQSVLAEGGINAALDTMGENDTTENHFEDTMRGGCYLESEEAVRSLTGSAPAVVKELVALGVPFNAKDGNLILRNFGGQKKKRTAYAKSSTGKMIMTALIDEARKYESAGMIIRYSHHELVGMDIENDKLVSVTIEDVHTKKTLTFTGTTIVCTGGINGFFEGMTTGTTQNSGNAAAIALVSGVEFADLEFIQYHPTTVGISDKRMLISEAARGEGGRLFIMRGGNPWYFMEEKYPSLGNLMPRDVVSREMTLVKNEPDCSGDVMLDLTGLVDDVWRGKLSDLRAEIISYLGIDPRIAPVPVSPGIHYFMGGIRVNNEHETNISGLFAAGEAACRYHGANRLGGNSMLGAIYGGKVAAKEAAKKAADTAITESKKTVCTSVPRNRDRLREALLSGLGIIRCDEEMKKALLSVNALLNEDQLNEIDRARALLGKAMLLSAIERKESRGAHTRADFPESSDDYKKHTVSKYQNGEILIRFADPYEKGAKTE